MNLPGSYRRMRLGFEAQGGASTVVAFRSRPTFGNACHLKREADEIEAGPSKLLPPWRVSVWDEVQAMAGGTLLRRIRILITDGTQTEAE